MIDETNLKIAEKRFGYYQDEFHKLLSTDDYKELIKQKQEIEMEINLFLNPLRAKLKEAEIILLKERRLLALAKARAKKKGEVLE
jgi:hypothetical protein